MQEWPENLELRKIKDIVKRELVVSTLVLNFLFFVAGIFLKQKTNNAYDTDLHCFY